MKARLPQDQQLPSSESKPTNAASPTMADIKSPESVSTIDSKPLQHDLEVTARFGRLLQQCRELTETCNASTLEESDRFSSSIRSANGNDERIISRDNSHQMVSAFQISTVTGQSASQLKRQIVSGTSQRQSPQNSFYSTDFSDDGSGELLVGFGKRRKSSTNSNSSSSSSSSSYSTDSSGTTDDSDTSEEETEVSEPSMPTIARSGLRLTYQQEDEVSALSFGGASTLVASAPSRVPLITPKLLPEENSRSRISASSSTPTKSLENSFDETKESSPESEASNKSSKSSKSGLLSAGGSLNRRSSPSGTEKLNRGGNANIMALKRPATVGDLPQLEEETSQASSGSPLPRKSISSRGEPSIEEAATAVSIENSHPNEYSTRNTALNDDISTTSSLSSVVSKARVSFLNTYSTSVTSVLSDRSHDENRSIGSFRKSASEMVAERQSSKSSIESKSRDNMHVKANTDLAKNEKQQQLDLSVKSGTKEYSNGIDLYEGFPTETSDELIQCSRNETTRIYASRKAPEEVDPRKPWRTSSCNIKHTGETDTDVFSDDGTSVIKHDSLEACTKVQSADPDEDSMSELATSKETLISMGLYSNDLVEKNVPWDDVEEETDFNLSPSHLSEKMGLILPKHISRTSTTSSITEWDFSDQNREKHANPISENVPCITSTSVSSSRSSAPSLDEPSPLVLSAALQTIDVSTLSGDEHNPTKSHQLSLDGSCQTNHSSDYDKTHVVTFMDVECEDSQNNLPIIDEKREQHRQSMLNVANDMSTRLEKSFLARSQQHVQANDFESRSYEDLSSASEEDVILAYLKGDIYTEEKSSLDSIDDILEDDKTSKVQSKTSNFWSRLRKSVLKSVPEEDTKRIIAIKDKAGEDSAAVSASRSECIISEMIPASSDSDESSRIIPEVVDHSGADIEFKHSGYRDKKVQGGVSKSWYCDEEFYRSSHFLAPLCFFLFVIFMLSMVAGISGSRKNESVLSATPTISQTIHLTPLSPSATPAAMAPQPIWVQVGEDIKGDIDDELGFSVSSSKLGSRFIVGSRRSAKDNMKNRGAASIYEFDEPTSSYFLVTEIHGEQAGDQCGYSVSMSEEGKRVAIGSLGSDKNGHNSGQVRIFEESLSKEWVLIAEFHGDTVDSLFGTSVSLSSDGTKVAIGAPYYGNNESSRLGKVFVYQSDPNATLWNPSEPIVGLVSNSLLGWSVSWSPDAELLAIGAPGEDSTTSSGYAKVYKFDANKWYDFGQTISNDIARDRFGFSVHLGGNDNTYSLAIGAPGANTNGESSGYAGIYKFDDAKWLQVGNDFLGEWGENLGYAVSLTHDASRMVLGVPNKLCNGLPCGQIQIIDLKDESPVLTADIYGDAGGGLGVSVSVSYDGRMVYGGMPGSNLVRVFGEI